MTGFRIFLREELGSAPGRELLALHAELVRGRTQRRAARETLRWVRRMEIGIGVLGLIAAATWSGEWWSWLIVGADVVSVSPCQEPRRFCATQRPVRRFSSPLLGVGGAIVLLRSQPSVVG